MMPVLTLEIGKLDKATKAALIKGLVQKASEITKIGEEHFVTLIKENDIDNIGSGTKTLADIFAENANR